jgi:DNA-binding transcriptional MocR family regulator
LKAHLPEWRFSRPAGGLFLWVRLPGGDAREFAQVALRHGVVIVPGPSMSADEQHARFIRLTFLWDPDTLTIGVDRLANAWRYYRAIAPRRSEQVVRV